MNAPITQDVLTLPRKLPDSGRTNIIGLTRDQLRDALIAAGASDMVHRLGYLYVLTPATLGPLILLEVGLLVKHIPASRRYPEVWY